MLTRLEGHSGRKTWFAVNAHSDFNVLFLQLFDVFDLLLKRLPLLVFNRLGNQDVVVGQRCVLGDKNNPPGLDYKSSSGVQICDLKACQLLTTGGKDICSFPFSLTTPINSSSSILGCNNKNGNQHCPPYRACSSHMWEVEEFSFKLL